MPYSTFCAAILLVCSLTFTAAQTSCRGRCGAEYYRGYMCQCDYTCLSYGECCKDFEAKCTTRDSCKGRCGEGFKRGRLCSCDMDCVKYKQCCPDYENHCDAVEPAASGATDQDSTFSEGDNTDMHTQIFPDDDYSYNNVENPEATPIPESTSGYGSFTTDLLDLFSTEPTQDPNTFETSTDAETTTSQAQTTTSKDDNLSTLPTNVEEVSTDSPDADDSMTSGTTPPQPTTAAVSSRPASPADPPRGDTPGPEIPEPEIEALPESTISPEAQSTDPTAASTDDPDVTTLSPDATTSPGSTEPTQDSSADSTSPASSTLDPTTVPTETISTLKPDNNNLEDVTEPTSSLPDLEGSSSVSPTDPEPDAFTTDFPSSTYTMPDEATEDVTPGGTTADTFDLTPVPTEPTTPEATSKPQDKPEVFKPLPVPVKPAVGKPGSKPEVKPLDVGQSITVDDPRDYQADDSNDTNLCSGRPVSGVTTLSNGTIVVFRGHFFWMLDSNRVPGPARGITQVWGVPSPIDTVFTRCNCQGKTYIFKGPQYWRFENDVLDPGYPRVIETGFDGLRGHITAALSVPQYQRRTESVYFFKRGGTVQKYSYQFGTSPKCGRKPQYAIYTVKNRIVRQAVSALGPTINIRTSWRGFPSTITAAVSIPTNREAEGYKYYVYSRSKSYKVRMDGGRPSIAAPAANASPQVNDVFKCPKKV
ncbi:proteoglycan 4b isoform X2 [Xyrichtys novacula]|uniref:Proteoglycan 4b isoform X2 n=1 Tax=Xyrichtys novacula TaxID=13765 RepID=A0AAV1FIE9_XYRNO|nr:proteoglycan 4b isoform X2 [Xyrichtys novacula]